MERKLTNQHEAPLGKTSNYSTIGDQNKYHPITTNQEITTNIIHELEVLATRFLDLAENQ